MADMLLGGIVINEVLADPNGANNFDTDGDGTAEAGDEYVELFNSSGTAIDISGVELWDAGMGQWFTFPPGTVLQPGGHAMVMADIGASGSLPAGGPDDLFFDAAMDGAVINNSGDTIVLYDPSNDEFIMASFNGAVPPDPTTDFSGFSSTATLVGGGEDMGFDTDGLSLQRDGDGSDSFVSAAPTPGTVNVCFAQGTLLETPGGARPVEHLSEGDLLSTVDSGPRRIRMITSRLWSASDVAEQPERQPVVISRGALGGGLPQRDLRLSQHHRLMVQGPIVNRMFGAQDVLIAARHLVGVPGIWLAQAPEPVSYFHVMMSRHELLLAEGVASESLYLGAQALSALPPDESGEWDRLFARGTARLLAFPPRPARSFAEGARARRLVSRHLANGKPLIGYAGR